MSTPTSPRNAPSPSPRAITSPAEVLSYVPHVLGFRPVESLVVLTLAGRRLGATLRVDLPPEGADLLAFAEGVHSFLAGDTEADGALLVVYTAQGGPGPAGLPRNELVLTTAALLDTAGLPVLGGWLVSATGWRDYLGAGSSTLEGRADVPERPLDAVSDSSLNAELVFAGSSFEASVGEAVRRVSPDLGGDGAAPGLPAVRQAVAQCTARCGESWTWGPQFRAAAELWDRLSTSEDVLDPATDPSVAGFLLAGLTSRTLRDFLLVSACLGPDVALRGATACGLLQGEQEAGATEVGTTGSPGGIPEAGTVVLPEVLHGALPGIGPHLARCSGAGQGTGRSTRGSALPGDTDARVYADILAGRHTGVVVWERVDAMVLLLSRLLPWTAGEDRAAALTMCGWFEYARGRGSWAAVYLDAAQDAFPGYRLALLLGELLRRGGLPAWARRRSTAWTGSRTTGSS